MPYGVNTGGGIGGGLAAGLQAGLGLGSSIYGQAQEQQERQREFGLRQQEFGLLQQASARADREESMRVQQAALEGSQKLYENARDDLAGAAQDPSTTDEQMQGLMRRLDQAKRGVDQSTERMAGWHVIDGVNQAKQDADDWSKGTSTPESVGPERTYLTTSLINPKPMEFIRDGTEFGSRIGTKLDLFHTAAKNGDWHSAFQHSLDVLHHAASSHDPDHDLYYPGLNLGYDQNDLHGHIPAIAEAIGHTAVTEAAINSDPNYVDLLKQAHAAGAQNRVDFARYLLAKMGGMRGLEQSQLTPDANEQIYRSWQGIIRDANPTWTDEQVKSAAISRIKEDPLAAEKLQIDANKGLVAAQTNAENARAAEEGARAKQIAAGGRHTGLQATLDAIDQQVASDTLTPQQGEMQKQAAIEGAAGKNDVKMRKRYKSDGTAEDVPYQIVQGKDGKTYYQDVPAAPGSAPQPSPDNIKTISGPTEPAGTVRRDRNGRLARSLGNGQWQIQ